MTKDKEPPLPAIVRTYLRVERLLQNPEMDPGKRARFTNTLDTLEHYMKPTERQWLKTIKEQTNRRI